MLTGISRSCGPGVIARFSPDFTGLSTMSTALHNGKGERIRLDGIFDLLHHLIIQNPGVPSWWPTFSFSVDVLLGLWVIGLSRSRRNDLLRTSSGG